MEILSQATEPSGSQDASASGGGASPGWQDSAAEPLFLPLLPNDPAEVGGYTLRARIGQGGMGTVFLSASRGGRPIALKLVRQEFADDPHFRRRFATEVAIARRVQGAYTVPVVDADTEAAQPWIATSYVPAPNLSAVVRRSGPLPARTVLGLLAGVAEALESIHRAGVIHRDLKPSNVITAADGPLLIDFGLARAADGVGAAVSRPGVPVGTPAFMSPEQVSDGRAERASDVFSLGSTAYFAATGEYPFGGDIAVFHRIEYGDPDWEPVPWPLRLVLARCLAKSPKQRPDCAEIIDLCGRLAGELDVRVGSATVPMARRGLLGEGWLPDAVDAEITRYRREAATTLPPRTHRHRGSENTADQPTEFDRARADTLGHSASTSWSRPRRATIALVGAAGATLVLLAGLLALLGRHHTHTAGGIASLSPAPIVTTPAILPPAAAASPANVRLTSPSTGPHPTTPMATVSVTPTQQPSPTPTSGFAELLHALLNPPSPTTPSPSAS
jgi:serine/threonine protein kinase